MNKGGMAEDARQKILSLNKNDFEVQVFRAGGKGGQKQNKTCSGVRIIHPVSGARGECREQRSQLQNKRIAFKRLIASRIFQKWLRWETNAALNQITDIENKVDEAINPEHIKCEVRQNGKWVPVPFDSIQP